MSFVSPVAFNLCVAMGAEEQAKQRIVENAYSSMVQKGELKKDSAETKLELLHELNQTISKSEGTILKSSAFDFGQFNRTQT
jgi:hypothetical protein